MNRNRSLSLSALATLAVLGLALATALPARAKEKDADLVKALPAKYQTWLEEVDVLISKEEKASFLELREDYHRDAFIERFWKARDPYPDTARNEFRDRYQETVAHARATYSDLKEERARMLLLNGEPADVRAVQCSTLLWPIELWIYAGSDRVRSDFFLVFYRKWGGGRFVLWRPIEGLEQLFQDQMGGQSPGANALLRMIYDRCYRGDEVAGILGSIVSQGAMGYEMLLAEVTEKPDPPESEWVSTFEAYSTDLPQGAATLPARVEVLFPGRRQNRTAVEGVVTVPLAEAGQAALADFRSYNFVLTGEVLAGSELFDSFRYKFDVPVPEAGGESLPLVFQRYLRPGSYRLVVKLEDLNSKKFFRADLPLTVPAVGETPPPPPDAETARLLAEANAVLAMGETTLQIIEPQGELLSGMRRIDTLVTGSDITRVTFRLDGREVLIKKTPPYSVELDLGSLPRPRTLEAFAYDASGRELASDRVIVNATPHRFSVRLAEPRRGVTYKGSLVARAEVEVPEGRSVERVEFFLNETRVATLYQPPFEQPIVLPENEPLAYVQAVVYLPDGNSTQDLVFVNAPDLLEEIDIQFVELYTTALDRDGRPSLGVEEKDFRVFEDGVAQEIRRFEVVRDLPIHTAVVLDVSGSMEESLSQAREAALGFFQQILTPKDRAALVTFNDRPTLNVKFTNEVNALAGGLAGLKAERGTALYDSLIFGLYYFNGIKGQRALLLLSDGKDESSRFKYEDALEYARRAGVTIYAIGLELPKGEARRELSHFTDATGGRAYFLDSVAGLPAIYAAIEEELRSQYLIAYQSGNTAKSTAFRALEVKVERPGFEAKTIRGYYP